MDKCVCTDNEISTMLDFLIDRETYKILDSKRQKYADLYSELSAFLAERNMVKSLDQCRTKFKALKSKYMEAKYKAKKSGE